MKKLSLFDFPYSEFFKRLYQKSFDEDIFSTAAQVAFYFSFALFPLLLFLVSLFGMVLSSALDLKTELFQSLKTIMPYSAFRLVQTTIEEVTQNSSTGKLTVGFFIALWSASAGIDSIRVALNSVYSVKEGRSWWRTKTISVIFTLVFSILISIALAIVFYGWKFILFLLNSLSISITSLFFLYLIEWAAIIIVLLIVFDLLYSFIPDHSPFKWKLISPGAITGIILWLILSNSFRLYLHYYNSYSKMYGSLGAVIVLMLWLYLTSLVILIGGVINAIILELNRKKELEQVNQSEDSTGDFQTDDPEASE
ncbi:MAG: YihY/virulence factor BrkB family protein [Pyrinomonadaceae bacterium]